MSGSGPGRDGPRARRAVLFDATGTLLEPALPIGETYARVAGRHGVSLSAWRIEDAFRRVFAKAPPMVFPGASPEEAAGREREAWREIVRQTFLAADSAARLDDPEAAFADLFAHYAEARAWRLRPGARAALEALRAAGFATAVVSNFDHRLPGILAGLGLAALLDRVVVPCEVGAAKPDPAIFRFALDALGALPARSVFVGDDEARDLAGARAVGMHAIAASSLATLADLPRRIGAEPVESADPVAPAEPNARPEDPE